jgi:hypothetical protein
VYHFLKRAIRAFLLLPLVFGAGCGAPSPGEGGPDPLAACGPISGGCTGGQTCEGPPGCMVCQQNGYHVFVEKRPFECVNNQYQLAILAGCLGTTGDDPQCTDAGTDAE